MRNGESGSGIGQHAMGISHGALDIGELGRADWELKVGGDGRWGIEVEGLNIVRLELGIGHWGLGIEKLTLCIGQSGLGSGHWGVTFWGVGIGD